MSISTLIKSIQDIMRQDAGVDGDAQRISQLVWMLFLKIFDDKEQEYEIGPRYVSPIPERLRWRTWAADDEGMTGDELLAFINNELFPGLKELALGPGDDPRGFVVRDVFVDAYNYMKSGTLIRQVINKINGIDFNALEDRHLFGDLYEKILRDLQSAGNAGEYYTPRAVTQFMVDMTDPQLGQVVAGPGVRHRRLPDLRAGAPEAAGEDAGRPAQARACHPRGREEAAAAPAVHHQPDPPRHRGAADRPGQRAFARRPYRSYTDADRVDAILTNPPFGGMEEPGVESNFPAQFQTKETADLFLALIVHLLRDGGQGAIVLPDGSLFGEGVKTRLKEHLLERCNLHTVVRLPNGVFAPYTDINTNLLFFTKGEPTREVWYFEHPLPAGYKKYTKTRPIRIEEFDGEKAWWHDRQESEHAWRVTIDEIKARNYNLDIKNPNSIDAAHGDPARLLADYRRLEAEIAAARAALKAELMAALERG